MWMQHRHSRRDAISATPHYFAGSRKKSRKISREKDEHGLTEIQVEAFREVFNLFDINGGGTIDADELDSALKSVEIHLTHQEIQDVLHVFDEDGNGEIDFEEFLSLMTSTERYLETVRSVTQSGTGQKGENILFSALAKFMRKSALSSLSEIERYYSNKVRKSPHVVGHYAAGARLIGLTEKQMAKHWATLNITGDKNADSPYAQPVCLFTPGAFPKLLHRRSKNGKIKLTISKKYPKESKEEQELLGGDGEAVQPQNAGEAKLDPISTDATLQQSGEGSKLKEKQGSCSGPGRGLRPQWGAELVALPEVNIRKNAPLKQLTIEDLPLIRKKVAAAYETFRSKQETAKESRQYLGFTDISAIPSKRLQAQFKRILETYSFPPTRIPSYLDLPVIPHVQWQMLS